MENKLYKIVKSYPFSPPVGTILHYDSFADWYQNANEDYIVESRIIEKHPEYFEEHYDDNSIYFYGVFTKDNGDFKKWSYFDFGDDPNEWKKWQNIGFKFFKNREDAKNFVALKKKTLSIEDLLSINHGNDEVLCIKYDKLKKLVLNIV
jgi:hypothetical protein